MNAAGAIMLGLLLALGRCEAVIFLETAAASFHTSTPGDNSGWQYEGKFDSFLGVPIAPFFFLTAKHIGGTAGAVLDFHGDAYTTIGYHDSATSDLRLWEVHHSKPFPTYAPLSSGLADIGATAAVFGRGTQRGDEVVVASEAKGWKWGASDGVQRWGRNTVVNTVTSSSYGELLACAFDQPGIAGECHLSVGDSGGGLFVLENGLWRLAGIHLAVDGPFRIGPLGTAFEAALYDMGGVEYSDPPGWTSIPEQAANIPSRFYSTRVAPLRAWIAGIAPESGALAAENYGAWQRLYFTPAQIAAPETTGALADFDGDGLSNMLEFALNLDPTFHGRVTLTPGTGVAGLPAAWVEPSGATGRLTMEFVRRSAGSGANLTYVAEFSDDLQHWLPSGTETATTLNPRWERVQAADSLTTDGEPRRFVRLRVELAP